jgi:molybdenum cofactor biosynthesis enzyme MoaA
MNSKIIAVNPTEEYFSINWQVSIRCNYDCMYCSTEWHDKHSPQHDLKTLQHVWKNIVAKTQHLNLPYKISFTGGELTTNKDFLPFVSWLRENYNQQLFKVMTTTNGSASYRYYFEMFKSIDNIAFSVHSEHIDEHAFFDKVIKLRNNIAKDKFIQVAIMDEFWNQDRIPYYIDLLEKNNVSYTRNQIDYSYQTRKIPIMKGKLNFEI